MKGVIPLAATSGISFGATTAESFAQTVSQMLRLKRCDPIVGQSAWNSSTSLVQLGDVKVLATQGSPVSAYSQASQDSTFMVPWGCNVEYLIDGKVCHNNFGQNILHIPPLDWRLITRAPVLSGYCLLVPPHRLFSTANAMEGGRQLSGSILSLLSSVSELSTEGSYGASVLRYLGQFFVFLESIVIAHGSPPEVLCLDDLLVRQLLLLMFPSLGARGGEGSASKDQWFEALLEWIDANCTRPISLSDLESQSHYSRRALQQRFRARFECTPMQWVRRRRLQMARQLLLEAGCSTSVRDVSLQCGYINLSAFSRDYRQQFGRKASDDLRSTR